MSKIRVIGDMHGYFNRYVQLTQTCDESVQLGDYGLGFTRKWDRRALKWQRENPAHRFIRGNHDNPTSCELAPNWIPDAHVEDAFFYLGGAWSIDWNLRTPGYDWWFDEELNDQAMARAIEVYRSTKPDVVFTHDFPTQTSYDMFIVRGLAFSKNMTKTRTGEALQEMFEIHQPLYWFGGHWHRTTSMTINRTEFHCLNELDYLDFDTEKLEIV